MTQEVVAHYAARQDPSAGAPRRDGERSRSLEACRGLDYDAAVQRLAPGGGGGGGDGDVHAAAARGMSGGGGALPHLGAIQQSFGRHDVSGVSAHVGGPATEACGAMGARAYASGGAVAFAGAPDLHTAAHEAAHVVQQRGGVQLAGGVGREGDVYERHADAVADTVVRGESAEGLLDAMAGGGKAHGPTGAVQRKGDPAAAKRRAHAAGVAARVDKSLRTFCGKYQTSATNKKALARLPKILVDWLAGLEIGVQNAFAALVDEMAAKLKGYGKDGQSYAAEFIGAVEFIASDFTMQRSATCAVQVAHEIAKAQDPGKYIAAMRAALKSRVENAGHVAKLPEFTVAEAAGRSLDTTEKGAAANYITEKAGGVPILGAVGKGMKGSEGTRAVGSLTGRSPIKTKSFASYRQPHAKISDEYIVGPAKAGCLVSVELQEAAYSVGHQVLVIGTQSGLKGYDPNAGGLTTYGALIPVFAKYKNVASVTIYAKKDNPWYATR